VCRGWPSRGNLLRSIMQADLDQDGMNDEEQEEDTMLTAEMFVAFGLANRASAASLMEYYRIVCPAALSAHKETGAELEHSRFFFRLKVIDSMWSRLYGQEALSENVAKKANGQPQTKPPTSAIQLKAGPRFRDKNGEGTMLYDMQVGLETQLEDIRSSQQSMLAMMESLKRATTRTSRDI